MAITTAQINTAIKTTLGAAAGLTRSQDFNELTEGMADTPTLQVYFESWENDISSASTDRTSFKGGIEQCQIVFNADVLGAARGPDLGEEMGRLQPVVDQIIDILQAQKTKPYFNLVGIRAFHWSANRVLIDYNGELFIACRFILTVRVF
jgi:hypothetical protein